MVLPAWKHYPDKKKLPRNLKRLRWKSTRVRSYIFPVMEPMLLALPQGNSFLDWYYEIVLAMIDENGQILSLGGTETGMQLEEADFVVGLDADVLVANEWNTKKH